MAGVIALKKFTDTIPIVSPILVGPVGFGFARSHARPGGNVTGVLLTVEDLPSKQLALAVEMVPNARKVGLLVNPGNPTHEAQRPSVEAAAAVVAYGFGRDRLRSFTSGHFLDNPGSARVLEQLGFRAVGSAEVWAKSRGAWVASVRHRLDRPGAEYAPRRAMSWLGRATMI